MKSDQQVLTVQEINEAFVNTHLEENYNFLQDDLVKLANRFISKAAPKLIKQEREACIEFVSSLNTHVAEKLREKRGGA